MHTVHNLRLCPYDKIKVFINSCHYHVTNIYGCLVNSENRRSDKRDGALRALDCKKLGKAINHCFLFIKKMKKYVKDLIHFLGLEGIDVPFFDFESILAATDTFSNAKMLGQGGYGPVYKVIPSALIGI